MHKQFLDLFVATIFFVTGFNALTYQIAWNKVLSQTIGTDFYSNTLIVAIFMLGLGLGGHLGAVITRKSRMPIKWFFLAEMAIALFGIVSIPLLRSVQHLSVFLSGGDLGVIGLVTDFGVNFAILLAPIVLMGTSLPIVAHLFRDRLSAGSAVGFLYAINIIGGALGALTSGIYLIGTLGLEKTVWIVSAVNFTLPFIALAYLKKQGANFSISSVLDKPTEVDLTPHRNWVLVLAFIIGFAALAYEMLYFRIFIYYLSATSYVFPIVLGSYLVLMASGTFVAGHYIADRKQIYRLIQIALFGIIILSPLIFLLPLILDQLNLSLSHLAFRTFYGSRGFLSYFGVSLFLCLICMLPVLFMSMLFPAVVHSINTKTSELGSSVGKVYLVQTYGNFVGALGAGFLLIPVFGTIITAKIILVLALISGMVLLFLLNDVPRKNLVKSSIVMCFVAGIAITSFDSSFFSHFQYLNRSPDRVSEDIEGTAFVYGPLPEGNYRVNIGAEPSTSYSYRVDKWPLWPLDAALTLLGDEPRRILIIGIGGGGQAVTMHILYPNAEIVFVELLGTLVKEMQTYGAPALQSTLRSGTVEVTDGRRYLNKVLAKGGAPFDYVQIGVFRTTTAGAGNLFTREFLTALRKIVSPNGVISFNAYMPVVKAVLSDFNNVIVAARSESGVADVFLSNGDELTSETFLGNYKRTRNKLEERMSAENLLSAVDISVPEKSFFLIDKKKLADLLKEIDPQRDDLIVTEYFATNTTTYGHGEDSRYWPIVEGAILTRDALNVR